MHKNYWESVWERYCRHRLGLLALAVILLFCAVGIYAPFFASSKPFMVEWNGEFYFPLFRYLFYKGFYTKGLDLFFNLLMFTLPGFIALWLIFKEARGTLFIFFCLSQFVAFFYIFSGNVHDPASDPKLNKERQQVIQERIKSGEPFFPSWSFDLKTMNDYAKLNLITQYIVLKNQQERLKRYYPQYMKAAELRWKKKNQGSTLTDLESMPQFDMPTLWNINQLNWKNEKARLTKIMQNSPENSLDYRMAQAKLEYTLDKRAWLAKESQHVKHLIMPMVREFHWEDDAGGGQNLNRYVRWYELTRINRKDLTAALIFGIRISLVVGITAVFIALLIGVPIGSLAGYYGGRFDIIVSRLLEVWEGMPTFFMLLLVVAIVQSKSIFLVITVIGIFGWTSFSRYIRGEFFKQRNLSYVEACRSIGFNDGKIIFHHILPNAVPPLLTLLPFAMMAAITSEAALSFLGLGEEESASWGVLMDEGRTAFPGESYLLWPPAILLVILLVAIALVGDSLRDTLDPKMKQ
jgi:peptide/nickel transport system permease protein